MVTNAVSGQRNHELSPEEEHVVSTVQMNRQFREKGRIDATTAKPLICYCMSRIREDPKMLKAISCSYNLQ